MKKLISVCLLATITLSGCISDEDKAQVTAYAAQAGVSYDTALSSMLDLQTALKWSGDYKGPINGVPSVAVSEALQSWVDRSRLESGSSVKGSPKQNELDKLLREHREALAEIAAQRRKELQNRPKGHRYSDGSYFVSGTYRGVTYTNWSDWCAAVPWSEDC